MRFSIIIPIYKVEGYIKQCVESVLKQDFTDYELILVDDGSPDKCGEICDEYANLYTNVKTLHKKNGGLSDARNHGLQVAQGEYIIFLDGDDWISEGCLRAFDEAIGTDHPNVLETTLIEAFDDKIEIRDRKFGEYLKEPFTRERAIKWACVFSHNTWPVPKKIYELSFLKEHELRFLKGRLHEDLDWTCRVMYCAKSYKGCVYPWYYHRMEREGSITNDIKAKNITDVIEMAQIHYQYYKENQDDIHKMIFERIMISVYASINLIKKCSKEDKKKVIKCIIDNRDIFKVAPAMRYKLFVFVMRLFGVNVAVRILNVLNV